MFDWLRIKRADWLIGVSVVGSVGVVWLLLVGLDAATEFAQQLDDLGENGYTLAQAALYVLLTVPRRAYELFGHAALIGALLGVGGLAASSELTALRAAGLSRLRIAMSAMITVAALLLVVVAAGETVAPAGEQRAQAVKLALHSNQLGLTSRSGLWVRDGDSIVNAKAARALLRDGQSIIQLSDVRIFHFDANGVLTKLAWAATAAHELTGWQLDNVRVTHFDAAGAHSTHMKSKPWATSLDPNLLQLSIIGPEDLSLRDLRSNIRYLRANGQNPGSYLRAFWARIFYPWNILLLVLAVLPLAFSTMRSGGLGKRVFIGILLAVGWHFAHRAVVSLAAVYGQPAWLANLLPALLLAAIVIAGYRRRV